MLGIDGFTITGGGQDGAAKFDEGFDIVRLDYNRGDHPETGRIISIEVELDEIEPPFKEPETYANGIE